MIRVEVNTSNVTYDPSISGSNFNQVFVDVIKRCIADHVLLLYPYKTMGHDYIIGYATDACVIDNRIYVDIEEHDLILCQKIIDKKLTCQIRHGENYYTTYLELEWFNTTPLFNSFELPKI